MARIAILLVVASAALGGCTHVAAQAEPQTAAAAIDPHQQAIDERKDDLVRRIAVCESGDHGESDSRIYGGRKGVYVGRFQFTRTTVVNYVRIREGRSITADEATEIAHDYSKAAALAKFIVFDLDGLRNWPACAHKLGLAREVIEIKRM
jgi:hypothetical protein